MQPSPRRYRVDITSAPLQEFLCAKLSLSRNKAKTIIDSRAVFVNGARIWMARHRLKAGDVVELTLPPASSLDSTRIEILFSNRDYVIANKPSGMVSNGSDSLETRLQQQLQAPTLRMAHRLDRDTTGCILAARHAMAFEALIPCFRQHAVLKTYHAIVLGRMKPGERSIQTPIEGAEAITQVHVLESNDRATYIAARLVTGRTHQIRKHLTGIGHPLLGDRQYGPATPPPELRHAERQMLHAHGIRLISPLDHAEISATAPLPADFRRWLKALNLA